MKLLSSFTRIALEIKPSHFFCKACGERLSPDNSVPAKKSDGDLTNQPYCKTCYREKYLGKIDKTPAELYTNGVGGIDSPWGAWQENAIRALEGD